MKDRESQDKPPRRSASHPVRNFLARVGFYTGHEFVPLKPRKAVRQEAESPEQLDREHLKLLHDLNMEVTLTIFEKYPNPPEEKRQSD